ncbi:hypothetical protein IV203_014411 [Nitzschia inconspicua]|uniref:Uncharacterized protein n=1 Tax=Nitzschia inconspicua TaxID=303405 RepID=A0A9K3PUP2_9STRA|nr:hypothetical protein IV203_014411 [Nitzschia inconspicua]
MIRYKDLYSLFLASTLVIIASVFVFHAASSRQNNNNNKMAPNNNNKTNRNSTNKGSSDDSITVAHIGNSIQYYNDMPRLLEHMLQTRYTNVYQNSCLRGGATLSSLFQEGNGMANKFSSRPDVSWLDEENTYDIGAPTVEELLLSLSSTTTTSTTSNAWKSSWDYIIMNDQTQYPARPTKKSKSMDVLETNYLPLLLQQQQESAKVGSTSSSSTVIFIQTAAYKSPVKDSGDLGTFDEFTAKLRLGYLEYAQLIRQQSNDQLQAMVAPVGFAYQVIKNQYGDDMWAKLYARDDFHPSPHGTLLEASVLFCTITDEYPPAYDISWWDTARYMQPPETEPLPLPTQEEADVLREVAWQVYQGYKQS